MDLPLIPPAPSGVAFIAITVITGFLALVAVILRLWSRRLIRLRWALDDYLAIASLVVFLPQVVLTTFGAMYGGVGGRKQSEVMELSPNAISYALKLDYIAQYIYGFSSAAIKLSLLAFYWRVFPTRVVRTGIYVLGFCCIGWFVAITITNIVECKPISYFWDQTGKGSCIDTVAYFQWNSLANTLIDLFTIILPVWEVMHLHMSTSKKIGVICIFSLGSIVVVASMIRFVSTTLLANQVQDNITQQYVLMGAATVAEVFIAIIGACGVTLRPVYRYFRYGNPHGSGGSASSAAKGPGGAESRGVTMRRMAIARGKSGGSDGLRSFEMLEDDLEDGSQTQIVVAAGGHIERDDLPLQGIRVDRDVTWTEENRPGP